MQYITLMNFCECIITIKILTIQTFYDIFILKKVKEGFFMNVQFCNKLQTPIKCCKMHSHGFWEIILHLSGTVLSVIDGKQYSITPGDIMIIPPNVNHDGNSNIYYTDMYVQAENIDFSDVTVVHDYDGSVNLLMNILHKAYIEKEKNYKQISDSLFDSICQYLYKYSEKNYKYDFVNELKNDIYQNLANGEFSITKTVKKMGLNIDYVRRCFKEETGKTPLEYLTYLRINYAKKLLLQETFVSVSDVSEKCGFNDPFYFSKVFKNYLNISPANYKKQAKKLN